MLDTVSHITPFLLTLLALAVFAIGLGIWALSERSGARVVYKPRAPGLASDRTRLDAAARAGDRRVS